MPLLHDPANGPLRSVGFMSGSGSNIRKLLEQERALAAKDGSYDAPYRLVALFTDKPEGSNARKIGEEYGIPALAHDDIDEFYAARGVSKRADRDAGFPLRAEYDRRTAELLAPLAPGAIALGGYMSALTAPVLERWLTVNVHPADLAVRGPDGRRTYTGDRAVAKALRAGARELRSTVHIVTAEIDGGPILARSTPLHVRLPSGFDPADEEQLRAQAARHQEELKRFGDWQVFPIVLLDIAMGRYARDGAGALCYDGKPVPDGVLF